jgi:hypothetical protein
MNGRFEAYEVALELVAALGPVATTIAERDSSLSSQLRRAVASVPLCLAEGARRTGKDREALLDRFLAMLWRLTHPARRDRRVPDASPVASVTRSGTDA